jgi:uncharacterized protein (TIGR00304 family)
MFIKNAVSSLVWRARGKMDASVFYALGIALVAVGIIIIVTAIILASMRDAGKEKVKGKVKGAGVIMIGPIPIIFGTDKKSVKAVLALALALTITLVIAMAIYYWLLR